MTVGLASDPQKLRHSGRPSLRVGSAIDGRAHGAVPEVSSLACIVEVSSGSEHGPEPCFQVQPIGGRCYFRGDGGTVGREFLLESSHCGITSKRKISAPYLHPQFHRLWSICVEVVSPPVGNPPIGLGGRCY